MASALYDAGRKAFGDGEIDWIDDTDIKAVLLKTTHTPDLANDDFYDDVNADIVGTATLLASKTNVAGVMDAADLTFVTVTGVECNYICLFKDSGTPSTSRLIALIDNDATGLPVTPNGGDIEVAWADTTNKIFKL